MPALLQVLTSSWLPVTEGWALTVGGLRLESHVTSQWPPSHYTNPLLLPVTTGKPTEAFPPPISNNLLNEPSGPPVQGSLRCHKRHWDVLLLPVSVSSKANQPCWLTGPSMALHQLAPDESPRGWVIRCICSAYLWQVCILQGNCLCRVTMERKEMLKRTERLGMRKNQEGKTYSTPAAPEYPTYVESVLKKEIFACGFPLPPSFPWYLPVRRSWNTVRRNSLVGVSSGSGAPANLTRKHVGTVDSALMGFSHENSSKQMHWRCQTGSPHESFHLTLHNSVITSHWFGSKVMTKWLLRVDPKTSVPCSLLSFGRTRVDTAGKGMAVSLRSYQPLLAESSRVSSSPLQQCGLYHSDHLCKGKGQKYPIILFFNERWDVFFQE